LLSNFGNIILIFEGRKKTHRRWIFLYAYIYTEKLLERHMKNINRNHQLVPAPGSKATRSRGL
jgi:hypothetical protein